MLAKHRLTESFIIEGKLDKVSSVDTRLIKNHILSNFSLTSRYDDEQNVIDIPLIMHESNFYSQAYD